MNKIYYSKNMAHPNKDYFVTFTALPEKTNFHDVVKDKRERRIIENLLQSGKLSKWFNARVTVTLLGSDVCGEVELPGCSFDSFEDFIRDRSNFSKIVKTATLKLEQELETVESYEKVLLIAA
jgi:hypothetical protein